MYIGNGITPVKASVLSRVSLQVLISRLFSSGEAGTLIDPLDATTLFQERTGASATTPAIPGDPVGTILDKSGNGNHGTAPSDAARPVYGRVPATGRRNMLPNNRLDGAVVGVVGSGGALPTGWTIGSSWDSFEILEISERDGFPVLRIRGIKDNTGGSETVYPRITPSLSTSIQYETNEVWTASVFISEIDRVGVSSPLRLVAGTSAGAYVTQLAEIALPTSYQRISGSGSTSNVSAETVRMEFGPNLAVGESIDITLEIAVPQLEKSPEATAVQITGAGGFDVTEAGVRELRYLRDDGVDDALNVSLPDLGTNATVAYVSDQGVTIQTGQTIGAGNFNILRDSDLFGMIVIDRPLTANETANVTQYLESRGLD